MQWVPFYLYFTDVELRHKEVTKLAQVRGGAGMEIGHSRIRVCVLSH